VTLASERDVEQCADEPLLRSESEARSDNCKARAGLRLRLQLGHGSARDRRKGRVHGVKVDGEMTQRVAPEEMDVRFARLARLGRSEGANARPAVGRVGAGLERRLRALATRRSLTICMRTVRGRVIGERCMHGDDWRDGKRCAFSQNAVGRLAREACFRVIGVTRPERLHARARNARGRRRRFLMRGSPRIELSSAMNVFLLQNTFLC
jgi:hypothetical protein